MKYFVVSLIFCFSIVSCSSSQPEPVTPDYQIIAKGQSSGFSLRRTLIIENQQELEQFWPIHQGKRKLSIPNINFKSNVMVAAFMGDQRTGGYEINLGKVIDTGKTVEIYFKTQRPAPGSKRTMSITQPFVIFTLVKKNKPIHFHYFQSP